MDPCNPPQAPLPLSTHFGEPYLSPPWFTPASSPCGSEAFSPSAAKGHF